ncbi:L2 [Peromyscus papillomavirus 1]|uniref:Minor capsid protein L2 n=1 Tax=Peromyscus papillomavirus 1 TaxID=1074206 RepID=G1C9I7_9PAPI|nr:L2 [Peromyscus papillomavirus 1]AEM05820.1 L2 [Peromyscus papillomavirus 1]
MRDGQGWGCGFIHVIHFNKVSFLHGSMARSRRTKRASATDLYRTCKQAGTCPPDVINKVEGKTVADKILQYGSAGVFLGGLGISAGSGAGSRAGGYVPLGETPGVTIGTRPTIRPNIPLETVGPEDIFPVDVMQPTDPSVIDLSGPRTVTPSDPGQGAGEIEVIAEIHPVPPRGPLNTPTVSEGGGSAILEVAPEPSPPIANRVRVSKSQHYNPAFHGLSTSSTGIGESSGGESVLVVSGSGGHVVGESIELHTLPSSVSFETDIVEETAFGGRTSTPEAAPPPRGRGSRRFFGGNDRISAPSRKYFRYTESGLDEIQDPRIAVGADYINPAFDWHDPDISVEFAESMGPAPNRDYTGVVHLSRPIIGEEGGGRIRVGRLGQKASMRTRSGITIGPRDFFYRDLSTIGEAESIELQDFQVLDEAAILPSDSGQVIDSDAADLDTISLGSVSVYSDNQLLEDTSYEFHGQLSLSTSRRSTTMLEYPSSVSRVFSDASVTVDYGGSSSGDGAEVPVGPTDEDAHHAEGDTEDTPYRPRPRPRPQPPTYEGPSSGVTYYLHPSLRGRKRKRRNLHVRFSIPDGILAS